MWQHHNIEWTLPFINGNLPDPARVPDWVLRGIKTFATYGAVSFGVATKFDPPPTYLLVLTDQGSAGTCRVMLLVQQSAINGDPVMVVDELDFV